MTIKLRFTTLLTVLFFTVSASAQTAQSYNTAHVEELNNAEMYDEASYAPTQKNKIDKTSEEMGLFDLFKNKTTVRPFVTNISDFTEAELTEWMEKVRSNHMLLPPAKSDEYVSGLIDRLLAEKGIRLLEDETKGGVRRITVTVERGESPDVVGIEYALYQPNVAYITTAMFPFAGDAYIYNQYCMNLESDFPFLQMGAKEFLREVKGIGAVQEDAFALRTIVPLVGADDDFKHLLTATKCLPIYGYDTRDGFHTGNLQPYAGKSGLNIQLEKLLDIYKSKSVAEVTSTEDLMFGGVEAIRKKIGSAACMKLEILRKSISRQRERFMGDNPAGITFMAGGSYPSLWVALTMRKYRVEDEEDVKGLLSKIGDFSFPDLQATEHTGILFLQSWICGQDGNDLGVVYGMVGCCPNEMDIQVMAWQIARFQSLIPD